MEQDNKRNAKHLDIRPIQNVMKQMDSFFEASRKRFHALVHDKDFRVTTEETDNKFIIKAQLPGYSRDHIRLKTIGNQLRISVKNVQDATIVNKDPSSIHQEQTADYKERVVSLPFLISENDIRASHKNGLLTIIIPKKKIDSHRIEID